MTTEADHLHYNRSTTGVHIQPLQQNNKQHAFTLLNDAYHILHSDPTLRVFTQTCTTGTTNTIPLRQSK